MILTASLSKIFGISQAEMSTIAVYLTSLVCLMLIVRLSIPFNVLRVAMLVLSVGGLAVAFIFFASFFMLVPLGQGSLMMLMILAAGSIIVFNVLYSIADHYIEKFKNKQFKRK